ncbi:SprT-like family-domain-containing protein [Mycena rosella]|uniref:SprT-like family-domain-containing protein n=1 Tax=Mycena rosella TaxID=1033263 RepID=A0AAD7FUQ3_MYCRO|nr:SprT-like family-domain-containing protein [Mycena rosella]
MSDKRRGPPPGLEPARRDARPTGSLSGTPKKALPQSSKWDGIEVVPDSEEERMRDDPNIIEISSDEEEEIPHHKAKSRPGNPVLALRIPGAWPGNAHASPSGTTRPTPSTPTSSKKKAPSARPRAPENTSTDATADEIVVLTPKSKAPAKRFYGNKSNPAHTPSAPPSKSVRSPRRTVEPSEASDSEIEILSTPVKPLGTPVQNPTKEKPKPLYEDGDSTTEESTSDSSASEDPWSAGLDSSQPVYDAPNKYAKYWTPSPASQAVKVATPSKASSSTSTRKLSLAARLKLERETWAAALAIYAEQVYSYLNKVAFYDQLPPLGKIGLKWNKHMISSAGKAQFHRDRYGNEFAEIHLACKIVDSHERIRNTLSHEMCHLACWMIDKAIKEAHGKLFHKWAKRVEKKDPDIMISVQHTYVIDYPYEWRCLDCDEIIGRFSDSLDITKGCSKCNGKLVELKTPKKKEEVTSRTSKMAAAKPQSLPRPPQFAGSPRPPRFAGSPRPPQYAGSPRSPSRSVSPGPAIFTSSDADEDIRPSVRAQREILVVHDSDSENDEIFPSVHAQKEIYVVHDSDSENDEANSDLADLATKFGGITIEHKVCLHAKRRARV